VARLLAELDPCAYVLDPLPNMDVAGVDARLASFVRLLREAHPQTPIVLMEYLPATRIGGLVHASHHRTRVQTSAAMRDVHDRLTAAGMGGLHCFHTAGMLGADGDAAVDGIHPTDLGFVRIADALEPLLAQLIHGETR